jgi:hypothetical protein
LSEVVEILKCWLWEPLLNLEEMLIAAKMGSILCGCEDQVIVFLQSVEALAIDDWVILAEEEQGWCLDLVYEVVSAVLVMVFVEIFELVNNPIDLLLYS